MGCGSKLFEPGQTRNSFLQDNSATIKWPDQWPGPFFPAPRASFPPDCFSVQRRKERGVGGSCWEAYLKVCYNYIHMWEGGVAKGEKVAERHIQITPDLYQEKGWRIGREWKSGRESQ